jgi:hypothetical protein
LKTVRLSMAMAGLRFSWSMIMRRTGVIEGQQ